MWGVLVECRREGEKGVRESSGKRVREGCGVC